MTAKANTEAVVDTPDLSPELMPIIEPDVLAHMFQQPAGASADELALGDLLSDSLFGEVIDISDLIPSVLSSSAEAAELRPVTDTTGTGFDGLDAGDAAAASGHAAGVLTILYDDDILASGSTIL